MKEMDYINGSHIHMHVVSIFFFLFFSLFRKNVFHLHEYIYHLFYTKILVTVNTISHYNLKIPTLLQNEKHTHTHTHSQNE